MLHEIKTLQTIQIETLANSIPIHSTTPASNQLSETINQTKRKPVDATQTSISTRN